MTKPTQFVQDPGSLQELGAALARGTLSSADLVQRYVDRIEAVDGEVCAWRELDAAGAMSAAQALDRERAQGAVRGPLHGIPLAVKDVIDSAGLPTRCNSPARQTVPPAAADAEVVSALRAAGAIVLGKVHTTEFAFFDPSPARNPHNIGHTPGGSSSGSAAAVAAGMTPAALGTQTVASVNRPAAYCGVAAFKPSSGLLSTFGVTPLAPMYDTIGFFGRRTADAVLLFEAACPAHARRGRSAAMTSRFGVVRLHDAALSAASPAVTSVMNGVAEKLAAAGHRVSNVRSPVPFEQLREWQWLSFLHQVSRVHRGLLELPDGQVGERLKEAIEEGLEINESDFALLRADIELARRRLFDVLTGTDAVLWPAAPGTAPEGLEWTGDPRFISPWTALGGPVATLPAGRDEAGLPIGVLLAGAPGADWDFASVVTRLAAACEI